VGKIQEIIDSKQAPGFIGLSEKFFPMSGSRINQIKSNKIKDMVKEKAWKIKKRGDSKFNPANELL